jgi:hypothetical protein
MNQHPKKDRPAKPLTPVRKPLVVRTSLRAGMGINRIVVTDGKIN